FLSNLFAQTTSLDLSSKWQFWKSGDAAWLPATVPGTVHTDLLNNKLIPDPFFSDNEKKLQWIDTCDWEYQLFFDVPEAQLKQEHIELQFDGIDTYADIFLNDSLLFSAENMFRTWKVSCKNLLHQKGNHLVARFHSATLKGKEQAKEIPFTLPGDEKVFTRKAQYQYGWDWG